MSSTASTPEEFICPISMSVMIHPLRCTKTGHHFERETIMEWLYRGNTKCPLTRQPLHTDDLVPDRQLQAKILKWKLLENFQDSMASGFGNIDEAESDSDDDDFDSAFEDILEITDRFRTASITQQQRQQTLVAVSTNTATPTAARDASSNRLTDLRLRVLQRREERIHHFLVSKDTIANSSASDQGTMSLTQLMSAGRM